MNKKSYLLSEILFKDDKEKSSSKKIEESIKEIGFKNTANIYSISDSAKFGGDMGWIVEGNLSKKLLIELKKIKINYCISDSSDSACIFNFGRHPVKFLKILTGNVLV